MHNGNCTMCSRRLESPHYYVLEASAWFCKPCFSARSTSWCLERNKTSLKIFTPTFPGPEGRQHFDAWELYRKIKKCVPSFWYQGVPFIEPWEREVVADIELLLNALVSDPPTLLVFGELHNQYTPIRELLKLALKQLRDLGFTHLGIEMMPEDEPDITRFLEGRCSSAECIKSLLKGREGSLRQTFKGAFMELLKEGHEREFEILYLNSDGLRDEIMAQRVYEVLKDGQKNKVVCLLGGGHCSNRKRNRMPNTGSWHSMVEILAKKVTVKTVCQTSGQDDWVDSETYRPSLRSASSLGQQVVFKIDSTVGDNLGILPPTYLELQTIDFDFIYLCPSYDRL